MIDTTRIGWLPCLTALLLAGAAHGAKYSPGASDSEIRIGNTMPYSGPAERAGASCGRAPIAALAIS